MTSSNTLICVGAVAGSYGVHGEIRLKSFCADPMAIEDYVPLCTEDGARSFSLKLTGQIKNGFSAELGGIETKEAADAIKGLRLFVPRDRLPGLPDDEFYHSDLIGLSVFDTGGRALGKVGAVHNHGAGDLLDVQGPGLSSGVLVPFTLECVPTVDLTAGRVVIDPPEGSFPDE